MSESLGRGYVRADFRFGSEPRTHAPHWLLQHVYGRELLLARLREVAPDGDASDDVAVDRMVDELGVRDWTLPRGLRGHLSAAYRIMRLLIPIYWRATDHILRAQIAK